eukprot:8759179-Karenia_brevis.AAC.1
MEELLLEMHIADLENSMRMLEVLRQSLPKSPTSEIHSPQRHRSRSRTCRVKLAPRSDCRDKTETSKDDQQARDKGESFGKTGKKGEILKGRNNAWGSWNGKDNQTGEKGIHIKGSGW